MARRTTPEHLNITNSGAVLMRQGVNRQEARRQYPVKHLNITNSGAVLEWFAAPIPYLAESLVTFIDAGDDVTGRQPRRWDLISTRISNI